MEFLYTYLHNCQLFHIDGLAQDGGNSSALEMELQQSCTKPSLWKLSAEVPILIGLHMIKVHSNYSFYCDLHIDANSLLYISI